MEDYGTKTFPGIGTMKSMAHGSFISTQERLQSYQG
jgi:hypothetical protein